MGSLHDGWRAGCCARKRARRLRVLRQARPDEPDSANGGQCQHQQPAPTRHRRSLLMLVRLGIARRLGCRRELVELGVPIELTTGSRLEPTQLEERFLVDLKERTRTPHAYSVVRVAEHPLPDRGDAGARCRDLTRRSLASVYAACRVVVFGLGSSWTSAISVSACAICSRTRSRPEPPVLTRPDSRLRR